jgi:molybdopterin-guanine dinucleotide biosynthesis protein A
VTPKGGAVAVGVVLAGGKARRMGGGDKCLLTVGGRSILAHVVERFRPQVSSLVLNTNGDPSRFAEYGLPVVADVVEGFAGPLAGVLTGMEWAAEDAPNLPWVVSIAADTPFPPEDLVARMLAAVEEEEAEMACAASGGRAHPVFGLWPVRLKDELRRAVIEEEVRKVDVWTARYRLVEVDFACEPFDPFFNINRPEDLEAAERLFASR